MNDSTKKRLILGAIILVIVIILVAVIVGAVKNKDNVTDNTNKTTSQNSADFKPKEGNIPEPSSDVLVN